MEDKQNTKYIDLRGPRITDSYRPAPASNPTEVYYAKLGVGENGSDNYIKEVYKLIVEKDKNPEKDEIEKRFVQREDGKHLVEIITEGEIFESLREHYDELFEEEF